MVDWNETPQIPDEKPLLEALVLAADGTPGERAYFGGYVLGFTAGFVHDGMIEDALIAAERSLVVKPLTYEQALSHIRFRDARVRTVAAPPRWDPSASRWITDSPHPGVDLGVVRGYEAEQLRDSGILLGFKYATSEHSDAETCTQCDRRIFTDNEDVEQCDRHGWMHHDCRPAVCRAGLTPVGCYTP